MLEVIEPSKIIAYGHLPDSILFDCKNSNIEIISFVTETAKRLQKNSSTDYGPDLFS